MRCNLSAPKEINPESTSSNTQKWGNRGRAKGWAFDRTKKGTLQPAALGGSEFHLDPIQSSLRLQPTLWSSPVNDSGGSQGYDGIYARFPKRFRQLMQKEVPLKIRVPPRTIWRRRGRGRCRGDRIGLSSKKGSWTERGGFYQVWAAVPSSNGRSEVSTVGETPLPFNPPPLPARVFPESHTSSGQTKTQVSFLSLSLFLIVVE